MVPCLGGGGGGEEVGGERWARPGPPPHLTAASFSPPTPGTMLSFPFWWVPGVGWKEVAAVGGGRERSAQRIFDLFSLPWARIEYKLPLKRPCPGPREEEKDK
eukprot:gnl/TRDRNA2_/TRDRNA2_177610_c1_seq1.p3 gnl/TRDRNA2_/TRDRNA2_177610_c1~~gnl/TRDRNA2_/TRDRNA2_177610_c1_seq1.p3  ORF type:complete len:103 (+),score=2.36 gnl/TRDRNA2_/TRDRNA2_177610_c1_seq1:1928-2236(+)